MDNLKHIIITVYASVPATATSEDISDFVGVQFGESGCMRLDNPCRCNYDIYEAEWKKDSYYD